MALRLIKSGFNVNFETAFIYSPAPKCNSAALFRINCCKHQLDSYLLPHQNLFPDINFYKIL